MKPFELQLELLSPVILPTYPVHLDGLLWWALTSHLPEDEIPAALDSLLAQEDGVYKASAMAFLATPAQTLTAATVSYVDCHRWEQDNLLNGTGKKSFQLKGGPFMRRLREWQAHSAPAVHFAAVGDAEAIVTLLRHTIMGVGRNYRHGAGRIGRIAWQPLNEDQSWFDAGGSLQRTLPAHLGDQALALPAACRPPYHQTEHQPCVVPGRVRRLVRDHLFF